MSDKPKKEQFTTPKCVFVGYPKISAPDFKYKDQGEFTLKVRLPNDNPKTQEFIKRIDALGEETLKSLRTAAKTPAIAKSWSIKNCPYKAETDDDGNETGYTIFTLKATHSGKSKKTGKEWKRYVPLFDAKGKPLPRKADKTCAVAVWGGSEGYATFTMDGYGQTPSVGAGVKLYLEAVKVVKLVSGSERGADEYGFGDDTNDEDGFDASSAAGEPVDGTDDAVDGADQATGGDDSSKNDDGADF
jgi:hypothetical protein